MCGAWPCWDSRGRPLSAPALSATGVAIGVATLVAVFGISASSRAQLIAQIDALGTNLLTVSPNTSFTGQSATLPARAPAMISRIGPVVSDAATSDLSDAVFRNRDIPEVDSQAITVKAVDVNLLTTVQARLWAGQFLNQATDRLPAVVLGHDAAAALGIDRADGSVAVWLANQSFDVVGILDPVELAPELDRAALVGFPAARLLLHHRAPPTEIYVRTSPASVGAVRVGPGCDRRPRHTAERRDREPIRRTDGAGGCVGSVSEPLLVARSDRPPGRRHRDRQRHGDRRVGASGRDRPPARHGGAARPHRPPVSRRGCAALGRGRGGRRGAGRPRRHDLCGNPRLGHHRPGGSAGRMPSALRWPLARSGGLYPAWRAARLSPAEALRSA